MKAPRGMPLVDRFWYHVIKGPSCWEWSGNVNSKGYGIFSVGPRRGALAHRIAWMLLVGDPGRLGVLHACDNRRCVRPGPGHTFLGDQLANMRDASSKGRCFFQRKTHCVRGHEFSGDNLRVHTDRLGRRWRECRACRVIGNREAYMRRKGVQA